MSAEEYQVRHNSSLDQIERAARFIRESYSFEELRIEAASENRSRDNQQGIKMSDLRHIDCVQRSPEWLAMRCGHATSTGIAYITAKRKNGKEEMQCRKDYRAELVIERLTYLNVEHHITKEMQWGIDHEDDARRAYEKWFKSMHNNPSFIVMPCGFYVHPTIDWAGASPDGLVGDYGLAEFKCPSSSTHFNYIDTKGVALIEDYFQQCQWEMACTGREWVDLVSFDPRMPAHLQLYVTQVQRDKEKIAEYEAEVIKFLAEVEEKLAKYPAEVAI